MSMWAFLYLTVSSLATLSKASGGPFGASAIGGPIYPLNCYDCAAKYPGFHFCNVNQQYGVCCPADSTDHLCSSNSHMNIQCTNEDSIEDLYFSYCVEKNSKQCGHPQGLFKMVEGDNSTYRTFEIENVTQAKGQSCFWEMSGQDDFSPSFRVEYDLEVEENLGFTVHIISGFDRVHEYSVEKDVQLGHIYEVPIFNQTYIGIIPKVGFNKTYLKFKTWVKSEWVMAVEEPGIRAEITLVIIVGGLSAFIITILIYYLIKHGKILEKLRGNIAAVHVAGKRVRDELEDEDSVDFDDLENEEYETPDGKK